jgi:hypothetical protein
MHLANHRDQLDKEFPAWSGGIVIIACIPKSYHVFQEFLDQGIGVQEGIWLRNPDSESFEIDQPLELVFKASTPKEAPDPKRPIQVCLDQASDTAWKSMAIDVAATDGT